MVSLRLLVVTLSLLAIGLLLGGCSLGDAAPTALTVTVLKGAYTPAALEAPSGRPIRLTLDNQDDVPHQLAIYDIALVTQGGSEQAMAGMEHEMPEGSTDEMPPVHVIAAPGSQEIVEFTPTQAGAYKFRCIEPGHAEAGMLTVVRR